MSSDRRAVKTVHQAPPKYWLILQFENLSCWEITNKPVTCVLLEGESSSTLSQLRESCECEVRIGLMASMQTGQEKFLKLDLARTVFA